MSRPVPRFAGHVDDAGQLVFDDFAAFSRQVARYKHCRVNVTVRRATSVRTLSQNRRLWMLYQALSDWSGHDPEEFHEYFKTQFLLPRILELPNGQTIEAPPTTRTLDIEKFGDFMTRIESWGVERGCRFDWDAVE